MNIFFGTAIVLGLWAIVTDLRTRTIPDIACLGLLGCGLGSFAMSEGLWGIPVALGGALCGLLIFLVFHLMGGLGGGDVKLMAGMGALLGPGATLIAAFWTALLGGIAAALVLGGFRLMRCIRKSTAEAPPAIPYAPAIAAGALIAFFSQRL